MGVIFQRVLEISDMEWKDDKSRGSESNTATVLSPLSWWRTDPQDRQWLSGSHPIIKKSFTDAKDKKESRNTPVPPNVMSSSKVEWVASHFQM